MLGGIAAARTAGIAIKINMVALKGVNDDEIADMARWCGREGLGLMLIETMPLGEVAGQRSDRYLPLDGVIRGLGELFDLVPTLHRSGGPARYYDVPEIRLRLGVITPSQTISVPAAIASASPRQARSMVASVMTRKSNCASCSATAGEARSMPRLTSFLPESRAATSSTSPRAVQQSRAT